MATDSPQTPHKDKKIGKKNATITTYWKKCSSNCRKHHHRYHHQPINLHREPPPPRGERQVEQWKPLLPRPKTATPHTTERNVIYRYEPDHQYHVLAGTTTFPSRLLTRCWLFALLVVTAQEQKKTYYIVARKLKGRTRAPLYHHTGKHLSLIHI